MFRYVDTSDKVWDMGGELYYFEKQQLDEVMWVYIISYIHVENRPSQYSAILHIFQAEVCILHYWQCVKYKLQCR